MQSFEQVDSLDSSKEKMYAMKGASFGKLESHSPMIDDIVNSVLHEESQKDENSNYNKHMTMLDLTSGIESSEQHQVVET